MKQQFMGECRLPGEPVWKVNAHKRETTCVAFNTYGDTLATGGGDNLVKIWDAKNGKEKN